MADDQSTRYPDDTVECLLSPDMFLLAVERVISIATKENQDDTDRATAILFHLGLLCYIQGMHQTAEDLVKENKLHDKSITAFDREVLAVKNGQRRWELAETYCKDALEIDLSPIGMLVVLKRMAIDDGSGNTNEPLAKAVDHVATELENCAKNEADKLHKNKDTSEYPEITIKEPDLIPEFFSMLEDIGTLHFDRDKYKNPSDLEKHDHIMALYKRIIGSD